ncbi:hypothetical protein NM688_g6587 [Phlebia brevispora]|uniref:Uncharacterized protein n=1 Tax=Phlebia brevispora TaxID=194682 RepID=A0ACC1SEM3_9APHY|nr:hypothetical protein NM688_g6587 [Phlebia brevispora]
MNSGYDALHSLPVELLYEIFILAGSHAFPLASRHIHSVFKSAPDSIQAEYIVTRYTDELVLNPRAGHGLVTKALRYPICTEAVLEAILRIPACTAGIIGHRVELPRRLFRPLNPPTLVSPRPHVDSWEGYPLTKAVASRHIPLVQFLLDHGAAPALKNGLAVHVAIRLKDLALVKMLIEHTDTSGSESRLGQYQNTGRVEIRRRRLSEDGVVGRKSTKKRKLEDRVEVTQEMLQTAVACNARDIVEYFMQEKSCMPDMHTVKLIGATHGAVGSSSGRKRRKMRR